MAIEIAERLGTEIVSADSRQIYRDIPIGTAAPDAGQLARVRHHFVGTLGLDEYFSAAQYEAEALEVIAHLHSCHDDVVMCGGSMLYVDAVCKGIDQMPTISTEVREKVLRQYHECGIECIIAQLELLDPDYLKIVDIKNEKRLLHALEICLQAGVPYSSLRTGQVKPRPFKIVKIGLDMPREELFGRINRRVDTMIDAGLVEEARSVYPQRHLNSLNTVGFKEMFAWIDGEMDFITARERIKKNTRVYAKRQLTWYSKDPAMKWFHPCEVENILSELI